MIVHVIYFSEQLRKKARQAQEMAESDRSSIQSLPMPNKDGDNVNDLLPPDKKTESEKSLTSTDKKDDSSKTSLCAKKSKHLTNLSLTFILIFKSDTKYFRLLIIAFRKKMQCQFVFSGKTSVGSEVLPLTKRKRSKKSLAKSHDVDKAESIGIISNSILFYIN